MRHGGDFFGICRVEFERLMVDVEDAFEVRVEFSVRARDHPNEFEHQPSQYFRRDCALSRISSRM